MQKNLWNHFEMLQKSAKKLFLYPDFLSLITHDFRSSLSKDAMVERVMNFIPKLQSSYFTKKGTSGKRKINLFANSGVRMISDQRYDVLSGLDFARYQNEVQTMNYNTVRYHIDGSSVYPISSDGTISTTPAILHDWQEEIYQISEHYNFGGSVSGGDEDGSYYLSLGYTCLLYTSPSPRD